MRKVLSLILVMLMTLSLIPGAFAEFEPVEGTPYGIPLFETVDDVDLMAVAYGHTYRRLLDLVDNIEIKNDMKQNAQGQSIHMLIDDFYFLDDGQYVQYSEQTDKNYNAMSYQLFLFDKDDPYYYSKHMGGRDKFDVPPEYIDGMLDSSICPCAPDVFDMKIVSAEVVDGLYVIKYEAAMKPAPDGSTPGNYSFTNCSLTIDPETSLIRGYTFDVSGDFGEQSNSVEVNYNVDKQPDYSIKY